MKLKDIINCNFDLNISSLEDDSRVTGNNYLYFAIPGLTNDGHNFIDDAVKNGAVAAVVSKNVKCNIPTIKVSDVNIAMCEALNNFYNNPVDKLKVIGVTGTDGKTTTSTIIYQIINYLTKKTCGLIGSNGIKCHSFNRGNKLTTPLPKILYKSLSDFVQEKCQYVSMEVSSERLYTGRIDGMKYDIAILTNVTRDHLNVHKTIDNYLECKLKLFKMLNSNGLAIINLDDEHAKYFLENTYNDVKTYGIKTNANVIADNIVVLEKKLEFDIKGIFGNHHVISPLSGEFNVYNLMASIITCHHLGFDIKNIIEAIKNLEAVDGRNTNVDLGQDYRVIIDYAHTPNALKNLLTYAKTTTKGKLITVTGSAGGKDQGKRSEMGNIVTDLSDYVFFTSDDPRNEDPREIANELIRGAKKNNYEIEIDRRLAIKKAISIAGKNDTVIIAGRGIDTEMPIKNEIIHLDDFEEVKKAINIDKR